MKLENIKIRQDLSEEEIAKYACKKNRINFNSVKQYKILKKSIDARNKDDVHYIQLKLSHWMKWTSRRKKKQLYLK